MNRERQTYNMTHIRHLAKLIGKLEDVEKTLKRIQSYDPELAKLLLQEMFTFEELLSLPVQELTKVIETIHPSLLLLALKGVEEEQLQNLWLCISSNKAKQIQEELHYLGAQKKHDVLHARQQIMETATKLWQEGKLERDEDAYIS